MLKPVQTCLDLTSLSREGNQGWSRSTSNDSWETRWPSTTSCSKDL